MNYISVAIGLAVANFICIPLLGITADQAVELTFSQMIALLALWVRE